MSSKQKVLNPFYPPYNFLQTRSVQKLQINLKSSSLSSVKQQKKSTNKRGNENLFLLHPLLIGAGILFCGHKKALSKPLNNVKFDPTFISSIKGAIAQLENTSDQSSISLHQTKVFKKLIKAHETIQREITHQTAKGNDPLFRIYTELKPGIHFDTTIPFLPGTIRLHPAFLNQTPNALTSVWAHNHGLNYPKLLHINPDLLAGLTFPNLESPLNQTGFDTYRKVLAWLYAHDDLMVDLNFLKGLKTTIETKDQKAISKHICECSKMLDDTQIKLEWLHHQYDQILGLNHSKAKPCNDINNNMMGLVNMLQDAWKSFIPIEKISMDPMRNAIINYLKHNLKELDNIRQVLKLTQFACEKNQFKIVHPELLMEDYLQSRLAGGGIEVAIQTILYFMESSLYATKDPQAQILFLAGGKIIALANDIISAPKEIGTGSIENGVFINKFEQERKKRNKAPHLKMISKSCCSSSSSTNEAMAALGNMDPLLLDIAGGLSVENEAWRSSVRSVTNQLKELRELIQKYHSIYPDL